MSGVAIALALLAVSFGLAPNAATDTFMLVSMSVFLIGYGAGLGTVPWIVNAEIYPMEVRAAALGQVILFSWVSNFTVAKTFLDLCDSALGKPGAFGLYSAMSAVCALLFYRYIPETKGKALEETGALFDDPFPANIHKARGPTETTGLLSKGTTKTAPEP